MKTHCQEGDTSEQDEQPFEDLEIQTDANPGLCTRVNHCTLF